jgi:hypothetical protein
MDERYPATAFVVSGSNRFAGRVVRASIGVGVQYYVADVSWGQSSLSLRPFRCEVLRHANEPISDGVGVDDLVQMPTR